MPTVTDKRYFNYKDKDGVVAFMGCATVSHLIENFTKALENIE